MANVSLAETMILICIVAMQVFTLLNE